MKKLFLILLFLLVPSLTVCSETLTLSTYHPAPFGNYDRLRLVPRPTIAGACDIGTLYVEGNSNTLQYCADGIAFDSVSEAWTQGDPDSDGTDQIYPTDQTLFVGIGTNTPTEALDVEGEIVFSEALCADSGNICIGGDDGGIKIKGSAGLPLPAWFNGAGTKFIWHPVKAALRAGECSGANPTCMDENQIGKYSIASGYDTFATADNTVAMGIFARATAKGAVALGYGPEASGLYAVALGGGLGANGPIASGESSFATGDRTIASGIYSINLGGAPLEDAAGSGSVILGPAGGSVSQDNSMVLGGSTIGVETATPSEALEVNGNIQASGTICGAGGCIDLLPPNPVVAFDLAACPPGWAEYIPTRDRAIVGSGSSYARGATGGTTTHTLTINEMPSHRHGATRSNATYSGGGADMPIADPGTGDTSNTTVNTAIMDTGGSQPHNNMQPYTALLYCQKVPSCTDITTTPPIGNIFFAGVASGTQSAGACPAGYTGNATYDCNSGAWSNLDTSGCVVCVPKTCATLIPTRCVGGSNLPYADGCSGTIFCGTLTWTCTASYYEDDWCDTVAGGSCVAFGNTHTFGSSCNLSQSVSPNGTCDQWTVPGNDFFVDWGSGCQRIATYTVNESSQSCQ